MPARKVTRCGAGWIRKDDDRKFEPLCLVYGHHSNALGALLDDRRVLRLTGFCVGFHTLYEGAERGRAALLEAPRQVDHAQAVGQRLLASWPHRNTRMRPNRVRRAEARLLGKGGELLSKVASRRVRWRKRGYAYVGNGA